MFSYSTTALRSRRTTLMRTTFALGLALTGLDLQSYGQTAPQAGQPPASGREPGTQQERDWVDNRWSRTDVGPFLASTLPLPGGSVAKGLSIKVGGQSQGTVAYDTASCALRAFWTGGFLRFDPGRFGLIQAPKTAGQPATLGAKGSGWVAGTVRYLGLHLHGTRTVLEYLVDDLKIQECPGLEVVENVPVFTRTFEFPATPRPLKLLLASGTKGSETGRKRFDNQVASLELETGALMLGLVGSGAEFERTESGDVFLNFPPASQSRQFTIIFVSGMGSEVAAALPPVLKDGRTNLDLQSLIKPGPACWLPELNTVGQRGGETDAFAVDTLTVPYENPWNALFFNAGVDFTPDGTAYVCTIHGDVWRVQGIDATLSSLRWKRFATGLFQPLGLKVRDGQIYVLGRDQITRLHDQNADGEADFYESFSNLIQTSPGGHDYVTSLEKDDAGNFYYVDPKGVHRISPDGTRQDTLATGFRNPNGMGVSPDGSVISAAPQQGTWTPSSQLCVIKPGGYYGFGGPKLSSDRPLGYDAPLCWIPHGVDNSSGSQVWVPKGSWGSLGGQMLHLLWGRCGMMLVLRDQVGAVTQGAVVPLPVKFLSGPNRGSFHPVDGHLYVAASTGWQTSAVKDGSLQRVRFLNKPIRQPVSWHAHQNGLVLSFALPLERSAAEDPGSYGVKQWNYRYAEAYGSKDWSAADPSKEGRDDVTVKAARLLPDGKSVFLDLGELRPVMQMEVKYSLNSEQGAALRSQLWLTLNQLDGKR